MSLTTEFQTTSNTPVLKTEAESRNSILDSNHGKIPSYSLWTDQDIEKESIETRLDWWTYFEKSKNDQIKSTVSYWITLIKKQLSQKKNKISTQEYCSKRMGDELVCDI
jgi:hypothetical protein